MNLQMFGGRGGSSGGANGFARASADGALERVKPRTIETTAIFGGSAGRPVYKSEVLEARTDGNGNVEFLYASPKSNKTLAKTNKTHYLEYEVSHGAVDGKSFGINWSKVNSISGVTYSMRQEAKENGLSWDGRTKTWRRK